MLAPNSVWAVNYRSFCLQDSPGRPSQPAITRERRHLAQSTSQIAREWHADSACTLIDAVPPGPPTAFTTTDVYYVTAHDAAGHEQSCPPHQICHNLSYYISQPDSYFTSDTTIIFLVGEYSFDREDLVNVSNVNNLTLQASNQSSFQKHWP